MEPCQPRNMIEPFTMPLNESVTVDMPHGLLEITRTQPDRWTMARAHRRVATVSHHQDEPADQWHVDPASALVDADDAVFDSWPEVVRVVDRMPLPAV